ncbi:MAG: DUF2791 family P-loop domain-containing protein [Candidatus Heimdallarchaeota archaeon]|nr:DUF2791 family P-loop domain-containing protein [Candidatus Heimdallarchaeota archaeon]
MKDLDRKLARGIMKDLSLGIPPSKGIKYYSSKNVLNFVKQVCEDLSYDLEDRSTIKFVYGQYGSGKSHLLKLFREILLEENYVVCLIEVKNEDPTFSSHENLARNVLTLSEIKDNPILGFPSIIRLVDPDGEKTINFSSKFLYENINHDFVSFAQACVKSDSKDTVEAINRWMHGNGKLNDLKEVLGVNNIITKKNGASIITTYATWLQEIGNAGLVILIDEAEKLSSSFTKKKAIDAYGNLKSIINSLDRFPGIFFLFATTPDFFGESENLDKVVHSVQIDKALATRIGKIPLTKPIIRQPVWNIEKMILEEDSEKQVFENIIEIYEISYRVEIENKKFILDEVYNKKKNNSSFREKIKFLIELMDKQIDPNYDSNTDSDDTLDLKNETNISLDDLKKKYGN